MAELSFNKKNLNSFCDLVATKDRRIKRIVDKFGYPPFWSREPNFEGLVRIILEQQVSLASAYACFRKLKQMIPEFSPGSLLPLQDDLLKSCGISRQKISYLRILADEIQSSRLNLFALNRQPSDTIREKLTSIKGIGNWTVDVYLLSALHRLDILPVGDLVLVKALRRTKITSEQDSKEQILEKCEKFRPYRSILSTLLWHQYIVENRIDPKLMD